MNEEKATVRIFRYDPSRDEGPRYQEYKDIPYTGYSVLDVLRYIYEECDQTLAFRRLCTKGCCGGCAIRVNGKPVLACKELATKEMVIEPHNKFKIIRDLVVDFDKQIEEAENRATERKIVIDSERCVGCGDCSLICPVSVYTLSVPPCQISCPINHDVQGYISLIAQGKFDEALASIREIQPFPGIVGRVCTHPCEKQCRRAEFDVPVAICALKKAASDFAESAAEDLTIAEDNHKKVAIVGSGPAGLMAAYDLRRLGYRLTVFEGLPVLGGMLAAGIPPYRLSREILQRETNIIPKLGVEVKLSTEVGTQVKFSDLRKSFDAILLAIGAHLGLKLRIEGEESEGVIDGTKFLRNINLGADIGPKHKAIIVGGGNVAVDCARTCLRLGLKEVVILYRRSRAEMPAIKEEIEEAEKEGVIIEFLATPVKVLSKDGKVKGVECVRMKLGEPDASGRRRPIPIPGSEFAVEADTIISAIGEQPDLSFLQEEGLFFTEEGLLLVDPETLGTSLPGVFAAGDAVTGPKSVAEALACGRKAAVYIDKYLRGEILRESKDDTGVKIKKEKRIWWRDLPKSEDQTIPALPVVERAIDFRQAEPGLTRQSAIEEAKRCLGCKFFAQLDLESCLGGTCKQCADLCWKAAITILDKGEFL